MLLYRTTPYIPPQQTNENNKSKHREDIKIDYSLTLISIPHVLLLALLHLRANIGHTSTWNQSRQLII